MPYITKKDREKYLEALVEIPTIQTKGDLEYCIFWLMQHFMSTRDVRYSTLHEAVYAATHCADEFRRRFLDARENQACASNGDVYPE